MSDTPPAAKPTPPQQPIPPTAKPVVPKPALKQTPQTMPGPGLGTAPPAKDKVTHYVLRKVRGTAASITAKIHAHPTLPQEDKTYLAAKVAKAVGDWITLDVHVFEQDGRITIQGHVEAQSAS